MGTGWLGSQYDLGVVSLFMNIMLLMCVLLRKFMNLEDKNVLVILFVEVGGFGWYGIIMSIVSVVGIIVGIVVNNVAEFHSRIVVEISRVVSRGWCIYRGNAAESSAEYK